MQAWLCENPVGVEALAWKELPTPRPLAGEVLIAVRAASLNFPDLLIVQNKYQVKPPLPFVPGSEFSGLVEAVGDGVSHLKPGDAVAAIGSTGGFATHAIAPAASVVPLPSGSSRSTRMSLKGSAPCTPRGPPVRPIWCRALSRSPASVMAMVSLKLSRTTRHRKLRATGLSSSIRTLTAM